MNVYLFLGSEMDVYEDPYNFDEPDPMKSNALESSLWEMKVIIFNISFGLYDIN